ncbi:MAG: nucleotide exchange factor GrpE [Sphaerochaetaceae bacterium]
MYHYCESNKNMEKNVNTEMNEEQLQDQMHQSESENLTSEEQVTFLESRIQDLEREIEQEKETYVRKVADLDNYRKRLLREKESAVQFANERFIGDLLPILDDFERAIEAGSEGGDVGTYADGVKMIYNQILDMLSKNWGLKQMDSIIGTEFSPHEHEALMMEEGSEWKTETVVAELQKGYYLHDRVLRTAKVKVGKPSQ